MPGVGVGVGLIAPQALEADGYPAIFNSALAGFRPSGIVISESNVIAWANEIDTDNPAIAPEGQEPQATTAAGYAAVDFTGAAQRLTMATEIVFENIFIVSRYGDGTPVTNGTGRINWIFYDGGGTGGRAGITTASAVWNGAGASIPTWSRNGAAASSSALAMPLSLQQATPSTDRGLQVIGNRSTLSEAWNGLICELWPFGTLTSEEITEVNDTLIARWGL